MTTETTTTNDTATDAVETGADTTALGDASTVETGDQATDTTGADDKAKEADAATVKDDADKGEDKGDKGQETATEGAPEKYDTAAFKMPEGVEFDAEGFEAVEPVLRDLNLSQDQAGKLMTAYAEKIVPMIQQRTTQQFDDQAAELRANLARQLQDDPEVGGKKLDESKSLAAKAIMHFIPDKDERNEFSTFLNESGLGNHPLLMRLVTGAGRTIAEASTPAGETTTELTTSEKFYGRRG